MVFQVLAFFQLVDEVVIERAVGHELQGADGVGHALEIVALPVGEVIHGIGLPFASRAMMLLVDDAVDDGVAEVHVGVGHVQFGAQHHRAFFGFPAVHFLEEGQVFLYGAVAEGAGRAGLRRRAFLLGDLLAGLLVHIGLAFFNESYGKVPQLLEIVGRMIDVAPLESQPLYVFLDGLHVFRVFFDGIGVVQPQVACPTIFLGDAKVHADGLGVSYMKVAVGLGRETGLQSSVILSGLQVVYHYFFYEIESSLL